MPAFKMDSRGVVQRRKGHSEKRLNEYNNIRAHGEALCNGYNLPNRLVMVRARRYGVRRKVHKKRRKKTPSRWTRGACARFDFMCTRFIAGNIVN